MKINHSVANYVIGAAAITLAGYAVVKPAPAALHEAAIHQVMKPSRFDWPSLGQDKTISLGETLQRMKAGKVSLYCSSPTCADLRMDIDDAMQIAGWASTFEDMPVESEGNQGIFVGPPG